MKTMISLFFAVMILSFASMALAQAPGPAGGPAAGPAAPAAPAPAAPAAPAPAAPAAPAPAAPAAPAPATPAAPAPATPAAPAPAAPAAPAPAAPAAPAALPPRRQPVMFGARVNTKGEVDEDGNFIRSRNAEVNLQGELDEETRQLMGLDKPKKNRWIRWVVGVATGLLAAAAIVFFILFLTKGDGKDEAKVVNPPQPAARTVTESAPAPTPASAPTDAVDNTARSSAAEAGLKAEAADKKADEAMDEAERVGQDIAATNMVDGNLTDAHPTYTSDACALELESRWRMPGSPYQRMLDKGWLTPQQVKAKAREQCAK